MAFKRCRPAPSAALTCHKATPFQRPRPLTQIKDNSSGEAIMRVLVLNSEDAVKTLPHAFKRIRLNLARSREFPAGSAQFGYEFVAPLDAKGHIDVELWRRHRDHCRVRRFWNHAEDQIGRLMHKPGGA